MALNLFRVCLLCLFAVIFSVPVLAQGKDIYVEPKLVNDKGINPFNYDNKVFVDNKTYVFDYFIVKGNDTLKYVIVTQADGTKTWKYVPQNDKDSNTISYLGIKTLGKIGPIVMENPNYKQTEVFLYHYNANLKPLETELTGVIENNANVWLHPFRFHALEILQLSPFPYIKLPATAGSTYLWNLDIGEKWPEFRAFDWKGKLTLNCKYVVKGTDKLALPIGTIQATKVEGIAETASGQSSLTSYYNEQFGFVKLVYKNLDGSTITMTLRKVDYMLSTCLI